MVKKDKRRIWPGNAKLVLECILPLYVDTKLETEEDIRKYFKLSDRDSCIDVAGHYEDCSWTIIEETASDIDKGIKQLQRMSKYLEGNGKKIARAFLVTAKLDWLCFTTYKNIILTYRLSTKDKRQVTIGNNKKHCIYVVQYGSTIESVRRKVTEVETNGHLS